MNIIFIGAGNLATNLAIELKNKSHNILQVYSRTMESAKLLAKKVDSEAINEIDRIRNDADFYIFSVKDSALSSILDKMQPNSGIWLHTAGSVPLTIFKNYNERYGVIYPFQTFSKRRKVNFKPIPFFIEANTEEVLNKLKDLCLQISDKVIELPSEKRKHIHLTGVFACNFVNHMYRISEDILKSQDIPFDIIYPLIDETTSKIHEMLPEQAQTGPAIRFDENIINYHLSLLNDEQRKEIYKIISKDIHTSNNR